MDLSSLMGGGNAPNQMQEAIMEYTAQAVSPIVNGEVKMTISDTVLAITALFDAVEISLAEINELSFIDYAVTVKTDNGDYMFSRMGEWAERFYDALCDVYNKAVLRSLFIKGNPILTAKGQIHYFENGKSSSSAAQVHVYENNVTSLPPDLYARRVPLCFVKAMDKGDYELTLRLDTGESYTYSKLGYDTAMFAEAIEKQIRKLREETLATIKEIDPTLSAAQASQLVKIIPNGAAAPIGQLAQIAPSFVTALETKIAVTSDAESYLTFKEMCDPARIWVGFRKNESVRGAVDGGNPLGALKAMAGANAEGGEEVSASEPYFIWLIAPSPDGQYAAVEFTEAGSATFVYRTDGDFESFARQINRALEAINFKREVIRLSDEELKKPDKADYYMASKRTAALQFVRANFEGRVVHSSAESWKRKLMEIWNRTQAEAQAGIYVAGTQAAPMQTGMKFCGQCGAKLIPDVKFCGACGAKL